MSIEPTRERALLDLDAHYQAMPPVAALQVRIAGYDGTRLQLQAPLSAHVNDKGCAFGGSLASLMTLAGWGLFTLQLEAAGLGSTPVYVADSSVRYRVPLFGDLLTEAWLEGGDWDAVFATLRDTGRASVVLHARVVAADGTVASSCQARYVAIAAPG